MFKKGKIPKYVNPDINILKQINDRISIQRKEYELWLAQQMVSLGFFNGTPEKLLKLPLRKIRVIANKFNKLYEVNKKYTYGEDETKYEVNTLFYLSRKKVDSDL
ncbi:hypothetical protein [PinkBerry-associated phage LS06-2018-MD08]|nr:hypothetical protein [PinkBerry-associated phage LS06-2018-MD08]